METIRKIGSHHVWLNGEYQSAVIAFDSDTGRIDSVVIQNEMPQDNCIADCEAYVLPGLIDCSTSCAMGGPGGDKIPDYNDPNHFDTPYYRAIDATDVFSQDYKDALTAGITTVCVMPGPSAVVGGQACVISTAGDSYFDRILSENAGMRVALGRRPIFAANATGQSPQSKMAVYAMLRESFIHAKEFDEANSNHRDLGYEGWSPVLTGQAYIRAYCHRADDIGKIIGFSKENHVKVALDRATSALSMIDAIRENDIPVVCPNTILRVPQILEEQNATESYAAELMKKNVKVALSTNFPELSWHSLQMQACECLRSGASYSSVIDSITSVPAMVLGIADTEGSLEPGKYANFSVWSDRYESFSSCCCETIIHGKSVYRRDCSK